MSALQITIRSIQNAAKAEIQIQKRYEKLCKLYKKITGCRVIVDIADKHKHKGKYYSITTDITIPGKELVSKKQNQDLSVVIREGFDAVEKLLTRYASRKTSYNYQEAAAFSMASHAT